MAGVTDPPFRRICRSFGADYVLTEFLSSEALRRGIKNVHSGAYFEEEERPIGIQIYGANPNAMAEAAALVADQYRPDFIDINFGCPVKKVVRRNGGSGCLKDLKLVQSIVRAVCAATELPVTVKTRSGWSDATRNPVEIGLRCQDAGATLFTLHARTRAQLYSGAANWDEIAAVVEALEIPVVGNGDIWSAEDAHRMWRQTGCVGLMIARGTFGNPWIFRQARDFLEGRPVESLPDAQERFRVALEHRSLLLETFGDDRKTAFEFRKHLGWYTKGLPGSAGLRAKLHQIHSLADVEPILTEFLESTEMAI